MRIILSEGSGLTSRQTAWRLGELGHDVEILSSSRLPLTRITRRVSAVHLVPNFGADPFGWLSAATDVMRSRNADLLFPTQEQVTILSAQQKNLPFQTIVPPFAALRRMQDKVSAYRTLKEIGAPQPRTFEISTPDDLKRVETFPLFVKRSISTASSGVRMVATSGELVAVAKDMGLGSEELIAQAQVSGPLAMVQAIADRGRLIAAHANVRVKEGVGGGASIKRSVTIPGLREILQRIVSSLEWHGGLSMDAIVTDAGPMIIDVNPRLVEPVNAFHSGVDLVGAMLDLTTGSANVQPPSSAGVLTHQGLLAILGAAEQTGSRRAIVREAMNLYLRREDYSGSIEELTPVKGDPLAAIPVFVAFCATVLRPSSWQRFRSGAVATYAVTPRGWNDIVASAGPTAHPDV